MLSKARKLNRSAALSLNSLLPGIFPMPAELARKPSHETAMTDLTRAVAPLIDRLDALFDRLEAVLPPPLPPTDWSAAAFRWRTRAGRGWLEAVKQPHRIRFEDLQGVDDQKQRIAQNTKQFVAKRSANNVLLTGARGTG